MPINFVYMFGLFVCCWRTKIPFKQKLTTTELPCLCTQQMIAKPFCSSNSVKHGSAIMGASFWKPRVVITNSVMSAKSMKRNAGTCCEWRSNYPCVCVSSEMSSEWLQLLVQYWHLRGLIALEFWPRYIVMNELLICLRTTFSRKCSWTTFYVRQKSRNSKRF